MNWYLSMLTPNFSFSSISILDSSCGDMNWMPEFLSQRSDVDFTGYDITGSNIELHQKKFISRPWIFKVSINHKNKNHNIAIVMSFSHADPVLGLNTIQG